MANPKIGVIFEPEGVKEVIEGMRVIQREAEKAQRAGNAAAAPFGSRGSFVNLFGDAGKAASKFDFSLNSILGTARQLVPALGFASAIAGIVSISQQSLQAASDVGKLRQQFRLTAEEISTLQFAARANEATNADIEKGLNALAKARRELAAGNDEIVASFADLNLTARDFQGLNLAQSFELIAKSIQGIDPTKLKLDDILGKDSRKLIPTLNELAEKGLAGVRREGEALGAVLKTKTVDGIKPLNDEVGKSREGIQGLANDFVRILAPALGVGVRGFNNFVAEVRAFVNGGPLAAVQQQIEAFKKFIGFAEQQKPKQPGIPGSSLSADQQREIIATTKKQSDEQIKIAVEQARRNAEIRQAEIQGELQLAEARAAANKDQLQGLRDLQEANAKALRDRTALALSTARAEGDIARVRYETEIALARQASATDAGFQTRKVEIDRAYTAERQKIAQSYYAELRRLEAEALAQFKASKDAQKSIDKEIRDLKQGSADLAFEGDLRLAGPLRQLIDREARAQERIAQLKEAAGKGDLDRARELRAEIESQARTIANLDTTLGGETGQRLLDAANAIFIPLLEQQKKIEEARESSAKAALGSIQTQIKLVEQKVTELNATPVNLRVAVDDAAMQALVRSIQDQLSRTPFQIAVNPVVAGSAVPGKAEGGMLGGSSPGPKSDNLLFRGTAGEFMQPVAAVRKYGVPFMESIRTLRYPGFADGGLLGDAAASPGSGAPQQHEHYLNIGRRRLGPIFGGRELIKDIVNALSEEGG